MVYGTRDCIWRHLVQEIFLVFMWLRYNHSWQHSILNFYLGCMLSTATRAHKLLFFVPSLIIIRLHVSDSRSVIMGQWCDHAFCTHNRSCYSDTCGQMAWKYTEPDLLCVNTVCKDISKVCVWGFLLLCLKSMLGKRDFFSKNKKTAFILDLPASISPNLLLCTFCYFNKIIFNL